MRPICSLLHHFHSSHRVPGITADKEAFFLKDLQGNRVRNVSCCRRKRCFFVISVTCCLQSHQRKCPIKTSNAPLRILAQKNTHTCCSSALAFWISELPRRPSGQTSSYWLTWKTKPELEAKKSRKSGTFFLVEQNMI